MVGSARSLQVSANLRRSIECHAVSSARTRFRGLSVQACNHLCLRSRSPPLPMRMLASNVDDCVVAPASDVNPAARFAWLDPLRCVASVDVIRRLLPTIHHCDDIPPAGPDEVNALSCNGLRLFGFVANRDGETAATSPACVVRSPTNRAGPFRRRERVPSLRQSVLSHTPPAR